MIDLVLEAKRVRKRIKKWKRQKQKMQQNNKPEKKKVSTKKTVKTNPVANDPFSVRVFIPSAPFNIVREKRRRK